MSLAPSTLAAVKLKLFSLLEGATDSTTEVWRAKPTEDHQHAENIYFGTARGTRRFVTLGPASAGQREESYTLTVTIAVGFEGTDIAGCEERLFQIVAQVELAIAENRALEGTGIQWSIDGDFQQTTVTNATGVFATEVFNLAVTARI